jgi:hypothetical protein
MSFGVIVFGGMFIMICFAWLILELMERFRGKN